jgi:tetratricopeptide (TPR) repeat protein
MADTPLPTGCKEEQAALLVASGLALSKKREYWQAILDYNKAIQLVPNDLAAHSSRGLAHFALEQYEKAMEDYVRAIALDPNDARAEEYLQKTRSTVAEIVRQAESWAREAAINEEKQSLQSVKYLDFEILPPGWQENPRFLKELERQLKTPKELKEILARTAFMDTFNPKEKLKSKFSGYGRVYVVYVFDNHVVAECPLYGNAAFVLRVTDDWQSILKLTKQEVMRDYPNLVDRITHTGAWQERLVKYLN